MFDSLIGEINDIQRNRLSKVLLENGKLRYRNSPDTRQNGLYWIYTNYSVEETLNSEPCSKKGSINFADTATENMGLTLLCDIEIDGFRLVYSGIGGVGKKGFGGLRERILEEYRGGSGTGSLAIRDSSLSDLSRWRVSYVLWSEIHFSKPFDYLPFSTAMEGLWRLHSGWPLLCSK
tara:strand:- start:402 stop:932 length:531 start_codon:yes stop_codon:yes gene_type:complete